MSRTEFLTDSQWALIAPMMPIPAAKGGRPFQDHRRVVEGIIYRYRTGIPWRDLPESFGSWKTVWKRHRRFSGDGTWDNILTELLSRADEAELIQWEVSVDSTVNRAHQHGTNLARATGGTIEKGYPFRGPSRHGLSSGVRARVRGWLRGPVRPGSGVSLVTSPWAISR